MNQLKGDKSDSESSSDISKSGSSSDSDSDSGSGSSSSSSSSEDSDGDNDDSKSNGLNDSKTTVESSSVSHNHTALNNRESNDDDDDDDDDDDEDDDEDDDVDIEAIEKNAANKYPSHGDFNSSDDEEDYAVKRTLAKKRPAPPIRKPASAPKKKKTSKKWGSSESESEESEDDEPPRRTAAKRKPPAKKNRGHVSSDYSDSEEDTKRGGTRRSAAAAVSYKEASENEKTDSEDLIDVDYDESPVLDESDKSETIERIVNKRRGRKGVTGNQTTIYCVEDNGDPNEDADKLDKSETEMQYLIKWKGWSHIHNTWESEHSLKEQKVKGLKKLDNYVKKEREIDLWRRTAGPEDIDYFECQLELHQELLKSYNNVDRIIAQVNKVDGTTEYFCKWESLPYAEATWEDATLVQKKWSSKVMEFADREASRATPSRHCKALKYRPKFQHLKEQPAYMGVDRGLKLRDYQMDGINWLILTWCKENSVILADEMGLGKTIQTICFLNYLFKAQSLHGPFLCVVPLSTMTAWQREFQIWAPDMNIVTYLGDVQSREIIRQYEWCFEGSKRLKFNAILTTYEILLKDKSFLGCLNWAALLVDEAHRLKNNDSLLYTALKDFDTNHRLLITGTPLQNSLKELWALLHFIMPGKFESWELFETDHAQGADKGYSKLHKQLEPFILRRVKKDVEKSLPAKVEQILRVEMTSLQKQYYKWILTKNFNALRKGTKGSMSTFLNIVIELKKCCNHAMLIRQSEYEQAMLTQDDAVQQLLRGSGKLVLLDKLLCRLRETGHRVLIFSQMVRMLDILAEYLQKRHFPFQRLDGSIKGEIRKQALDHFNAEGSQDFCFLLSTRAGGLGINLATADTVIIFDSDWNPQNDLQAQARAHRIGQKNQVNIYRLVTARSVEEEIVERAKQKMVLDHLVIQRMDTTGRTVLDKNGSTSSTPFNKEDLSAILKFGAEELFKDELENDDDLVCDIDEILRRAETRDEAPSMAGDELLSAFKVASFAAFDEDKHLASPNLMADNEGDGDTKDWAEIIPEDFRRAVEDQERSKEMEDLYLPPRRKTAMHQSNLMNEPETKQKKRKKPADDESDDGSDASGDDRPKRRGRPPLKEKFSGFTDAELRRFIKSYKKFPAPLKRLDAIACDAELQEKPLQDLKKIGEKLHARCVAFLKDLPPDMKEIDANAEKKRGARAGFSVKFGGVSFNAKTLIACEQELQPLDEYIPNTQEERLKWTLEIKTRPANFDVDWGANEDSKLLCGIYQYGIGSWEAMKMDPSLGLSSKILSNENKKPQAKHLQSRAEYLLKIIRKNVELRKGTQKTRKPRKPKEVKTPKEATELDHISTDDDKKAVNNHATNENATNGVAVATEKKPKKKEPKKKKKQEGPMHFTANSEPRALDVIGDLDPTIFNECKEKMRPVKKALRALDYPDESLSKNEQMQSSRSNLVSIGKQIESCLTEYKDPDKIKEWRSNLWYFVSKFTEYEPKRLFRLYKCALSKEAEKASASSTGKETSKDTRTSPHNDLHIPKIKRDNSSSSSNIKDGRDRKESTSSIDKERERRERKEKKKHHRDKKLSIEENGKPRRLEEGECEPDSSEYRRHPRDRSKDKETKKWNEYQSNGADGRERSRVRNDSGSISSPLVNARSSVTSTPQRMVPGGYDRPGYHDDRWTQRSEGYYMGDYRFNEYNSRPGTTSYHRDRDHRDRDRRLDKRGRYAPYPPSSHYPPGNAYYSGGDMYRDRYPPPGNDPAMEWPGREREYSDYRRDYERRPPPPANS